MPDPVGPARLRLRDALPLAILALAAALALAAPGASALSIDAGLDMLAVPGIVDELPLDVSVRADVEVAAAGAPVEAQAAEAEPARADDPFDTTGAADEPLARGVVALAQAPATRATAGAALWLALAALKQAGLASFAGYARISKSEVLDHETRDAIHRAVTERPGLSVTEVQALLGLGWGTTIYHLDRLESAGVIASARSGVAKRFYPRAAIAPAERATRAVLARPQLARLASRVLEEPGLSQQELAARLGITPGAATKQLAALEGAGLVERVRDGKSARVAPTEALAAMLAHERAASIATAEAPLTGFA